MIKIKMEQRFEYGDLITTIDGDGKVVGVSVSHLNDKNEDAGEITAVVYAVKLDQSSIDTRYYADYYVAPLGEKPQSVIDREAAEAANDNNADEEPTP